VKTSETNAANSATSASNDATTVANLYDSFDDRYLGAKSSEPSLDNDGDALIVGALYFNSTEGQPYIYSSGGWIKVGSTVNGTSQRSLYTATAGQTSFAATYDVGFVDVFLNGIKLILNTDFTATSGTAIVLTSGATAGDVVDIVAYGNFEVANHYNKQESDARYALADDALALAIALG
jgi:hypothetical protein